MSNEITISGGVTIKKDNLFRNYPITYRADMTGMLGPTPGAFNVGTGGVIVDLSRLTTPGLCIITNYDDDNYVTAGIYDPQTDIFYPYMEIPAGQSQPFFMAREILEEYTSTGTGTTGPTNQFMIKANTGICAVSVDAYDK